MKQKSFDHIHCAKVKTVPQSDENTQDPITARHSMHSVLLSHRLPSKVRSIRASSGSMAELASPRGDVVAVAAIVVVGSGVAAFTDVKVVGVLKADSRVFVVEAAVLIAVGSQYAFNVLIRCQVRAYV